MEIHIIGTGGIGSNLISLLLPALRNGVVAKQLDGLSFHLHDADIVEEKNLVHQRFVKSQIDMRKVEALANDYDLIHPKIRV
ncbi:MAG: ThiF family adenylyltransferase, partial [Candidatus Thermoplasmatota archaeon]|nr:ThiF family adenylyltransferase [Candidatus Thermoplasmatota archaeon]